MKRRRLKKPRRLRARKTRASRIRRRSRSFPVVWRKLPVRASEIKGKSADRSLSFASLDFPGRHVLSALELADRVGCTTRHIFNLILEGHLRAINISGRKSADRHTIRIPIESWRQFLNERTL
jgi:hypothetical protein